MRSAFPDQRPVAIPCGAGHLQASLSVPERAAGLALIAADTGHGRDAGVQRALVGAVHQAGFGTLLVDLLTPADLSDPASAAAARIDATGLAARLHAVREWIATQPALALLPLALCGSDGAGAAALVEAGCNRRGIAAVVCDCRSPERASAALSRVRAPVLFVAEVGDLPALERIEEAGRLLRVAHALASVPGPRTGYTRTLRMAEVGHQVARWLSEHAAPARARGRAGNEAHSRGAG